MPTLRPAGLSSTAGASGTASGGNDGHNAPSPINVGTSPLTVWFSTASFGVSTTWAHPIDSLVVYPFGPLGVARTVDQIAFEVTTAGGAGSVARAGIYAATSATNIYPDALVVDGGEFVTTGGTGVKTTTISVALVAGKLYWLAYLAGVANPTVRAWNVGASGIMVGIGPTFSTTNHRRITVAQAYGALPSTFPAGGALSGSGLPVIGVRFSA